MITDRPPINKHSFEETEEREGNGDKIVDLIFMSSSCKASRCLVFVRVKTIKTH